MWKQIKKIGWRISGIYFWTYIILRFIGYIEFFNSIDKQAFLYISQLLELIGATPVNSFILPKILKIGWILLLVELKPFQFVGLIFYLLFFPISLVFYIGSGLYNLFFKKVNNTEPEVIEIQPEKKQIKRKFKIFKKIREFPKLTFLWLLLFSWFLIFGDAVSYRVSIIGVCLSGIIFFILLFRLFTKTKPPNQTKNVLFLWLEKLPKWAIEHKNKTLEASEAKNVTNNFYLLKFQRIFLVVLSRLMKKNQTASQISVFILLEFITNMLMIAMCGVLFWGLAIKTIDPSILDLGSSINSSLAYFLPGIDSPRLPAEIPFWIQVGTSTTSWILFVLYISVAGNIIPDKQRVYTEQLISTRLVFRKALICLHKDRKTIKELVNVHESLKKEVEEIQNKQNILT